MIRKATSLVTRKSLIFLRILLPRGVRWSMLLTGSMQFGTLVGVLNAVISVHEVPTRLCITAPYAGNRLFETGDEKIFQMNRNKGHHLQVLFKI
jgi:hypothetical protein